MSKESHLITVPRSYLEELEEFYEAHKDSGYNIYGVHRINMLPPSSTRISSDREDILFLDENEITDKKYDKVIVVDSVGRQKSVFVRNAFYDNF